MSEQRRISQIAICDLECSRHLHLDILVGAHDLSDARVSLIVTLQSQPARPLS
jgi:hypothetical protein